MRDPRGFLFILTGLALGLGLGLLIAWVLAPVQYVDTSPASLRVDFKDDYRGMIASAFDATGDLQRARARMSTLGDPAQTLDDQSQRMSAKGLPQSAIQALTVLSAALQAAPPSPAPITSLPPLTAAPSPSLPPASPTLPSPTPASSPQPSETPAVEDTPTNTPSPIPTLPRQPLPTATATPAAPFELQQQSSLCEPSRPGLLQIYLVDAAGKPVAGVELILTWFDGEDHFFSGLKPEINNGYADFAMKDKVEYDLSFANGGARVTGLRAPACTDPSGKPYPGSLRLDFKQP